jgi:hypothetical protein
MNFETDSEPIGAESTSDLPRYNRFYSVVKLQG